MISNLDPGGYGGNLTADRGWEFDASFVFCYSLPQEKDHATLISSNSHIIFSVSLARPPCRYNIVGWISRVNLIYILTSIPISMH